VTYLKPDVSGYTHFRGSGVFAADGGTSAATPVVAGLVAAFRSRFPFDATDFRTSPAAIRNLLMRTAEDRGNIGFDFHFGWGIVSGRKLALIRSLSVMQPQDEAATSIDELADVEALLDRIEGLDEVQPIAEEIEAAREHKTAEIARPGEFDILPEPVDASALITGEFGRTEGPPAGARSKKTKSKQKATKPAAEQTEVEVELH
jgi:hypothetical protein